MDKNKDSLVEDILLIYASAHVELVGACVIMKFLRGPVIKHIELSHRKKTVYEVHRIKCHGIEK